MADLREKINYYNKQIDAATSEADKFELIEQLAELEGTMV